MGMFNKFKEKAEKNFNKIEKRAENIKREDRDNYNREMFKGKKDLDKNNNFNEVLDDFEEDFNEDFDKNRSYEDEYSNLQPSQKSESFHFFILENQYRDLERMIRGVKDVWDNKGERWRIKKKDRHCFTDEEAEDILRTAQSHLSPDIKLAIFHKEEYPIILTSIFEQLYVMFKSVMEYKFGRFGNITEQYKMKQQAVNIFMALTMRIKANYSRAIMGSENKATHQSVKGQESLHSNERKDGYNDSYT